jgi:hypothetical protein
MGRAVEMRFSKLSPNCSEIVENIEKHERSNVEK